jgi:hypothetical protein
LTVARSPASASRSTLTATTGRDWATEAVAALLESGRPVAGGWPGTLSEARVRFDTALTLASSVARLLDRDRESFARRTYHAARGAWAARAVREPAL